MPVSVKVSWTFPGKDVLLLRIESFFLVVLAILVFLLSFLQLGGRLVVAIIYTAAFLGVYGLASALIQKWQKAKEEYKLTKTHLEVVRRKRNIIRKDKIPLKDIHRHKLDKIFLGGYVVTRKGEKHLLFFNSRGEANKVEKHLQKYLKKK